MARKQVYVRKFLNKPRYHGTAFVLADASVVGPGKWDYTAILTIGDCSRQINLDLDLSGGEATANTLYKLDTLIDALTKVRAVAETRLKVDDDD